MNREAWLHALAQSLVPMFAEAGFPLDMSRVRISVGFPRGGAGTRKAIGQCWSQAASSDGHTEIFVSPVLGDAKDADHVLVHELVHHVVGLQCGHKGAFRKCATALGLTGKMTATTAGDALRTRLNALTAALGPYPHAALNPAEGIKKQGTRLIKVQCELCGCIARMSRAALDSAGAPICGCVDNADIQERMAICA